MSSAKHIEFFDKIVPLSQCVIGTVVAVCDLYDKMDRSRYTYSHIVGFSSNCLGERLLVIQEFDQDGGIRSTRGIHPMNCCIEDF